MQHCGDDAEIARRLEVLSSGFLRRPEIDRVQGSDATQQTAKPIRHLSHAVVFANAKDRVPDELVVGYEDGDDRAGEDPIQEDDELNWWEDAAQYNENERAEQNAKHTKPPRTREDWERGWRHIEPMFGDVAPETISMEMLDLCITG